LTALEDGIPVPHKIDGALTGLPPPATRELRLILPPEKVPAPDKSKDPPLLEVLIDPPAPVPEPAEVLIDPPE
jgi:hypothetical protein